MNVLNSPEFNRLQGAMNAAEMRQRVISNNIANADTPKFKRSEVVFEQLLEQSMGGNRSEVVGKRTNARHIPIGGTSSAVPGAKVTTDESSVMNNDINNVDIDREMSLLAKNQLNYNFYVQQINHDVKMMRLGIEGRV
ncbi:flagellar basal body rod protein FlgB [Paenibacillus silvisoli]|uniref:flagellar basal body rod protein FlgB n=1 Tax=Paenibacillus silvisoli TaxID=3110539 RepID=UPI0028057AC9|nr:flagellar basal body rod protein FlgB [Paenibacillus silvisoli]